MFLVLSVIAHIAAVVAAIIGFVLIALIAAVAVGNWLMERSWWFPEERKDK